MVPIINLYISCNYINVTAKFNNTSNKIQQGFNLSLIAKFGYNENDNNDAQNY